jgi:hypothetical protein
VSSDWKPCLLRALLADRQDLLLGLVEDALHGLALRIEGVGRDVVAGRDQLAQDGALAHDFRIAADIAGTGHILRQLVQVHQAADFLGLAHALQMLVDRDHVGRLAGVDQLADGFVDQLVLVR